MLAFNIAPVSFKEGWPAPNKDRWPVLKTDGWVFGLQEIGVRRAVNQGMAPPVLAPTTNLLLSSDKANRFSPACYRYTHTGFLVCTVMATPVITLPMASGSVLQRSVFFFAPVRQAFMSGNGEEQMITACQLTPSFKYFDQKLLTFGCCSSFCIKSSE